MASLSIPEYRQSVCDALAGEWSEKSLTSVDFWTFSQADAMYPTLWLSMSAAQQAQALPFIQHPMSKRIFAADARRMKNATARVLRAFNANNIPVICMRGLAVSETCYPQPYMRPHTDIDILFEAKHTLRAKQIVGNDLQYNPLPAYPMLFKQGDIPLDMHTEPLGIERILSWANLTPLRAPDFFKYAEQGELAGEPALLVHERLMLPYLCFHALKHSFERLVWLYDIALMAEQVNERGNWEEVLEGIREYKLELPCFYAFSYVAKHMNAPIPKEVLDKITPNMGFVERRLFARFMKQEILPYLAERLFSRMLPSWSLRLEFWRETIYPRYEVRQQIAGSGCVKCNFMRTRLKQIGAAAWSFSKEMFYMVRA